MAMSCPVLPLDDYLDPVTVIVLIPGQGEGWRVSNHAFSRLSDRVSRTTLSPKLQAWFDQGAAVQLLDLCELTDLDRQEVARALRDSARELRSALLGQRDPDAWTPSFSDALANLEMWTDGLVS